MYIIPLEINSDFYILHTFFQNRFILQSVKRRDI